MAKITQAKKENFLYFSHKRKKCRYTVTAANATSDWDSDGETQTISLTSSSNGVDSLNAAEFDVFITHKNDKDSESSVVGSAYNTGAGVLAGKPSGTAAGSFVAGERVKLASAAYTVGGTRNETLTIKKANHTGGDTTNGYNLETGDIVEVEFEPIAGRAVVYPADMFLGAKGTNTTTTVLMFKAKEGVNDNVDTVTLTHDASITTNKGAMSGFAYISNMMAAVCEAGPHTKGDFIEVVDMYDDIFFGDPAHNEINITQSIIAHAS